MNIQAIIKFNCLLESTMMALLSSFYLMTIYKSITSDLEFTTKSNFSQVKITLSLAEADYNNSSKHSAADHFLLWRIRKEDCEKN